MIFELALQLHRTVGELEATMTMGELALWLEFFAFKNRRPTRLGTHAEAGDEAELDEDDLAKLSPKQIGAMFGAKVVH